MTAHAYLPEGATPLIFLDTETTGLQPDRHTPWEIAWVTALHNKGDRTLALVDRFQATVPLNFKETENADPEALKVGRYDERKVDGFRPREDVVARLKWAATRIGALAAELDAARSEASTPPPPIVPHLVGAVPSFDHAMLCMNWLGWPGFGEGLWHYHLIDVEALAAGTLGYPPPYKSDDLTAMLGIKVDEKDKHTAMGDVMWAVQMYAAVYRLTIKETM